MSAVWGNTTGGEDGQFGVGRFTLSNDAAGTFFGRSQDSSQPGVLIPFSGTIANGVMAIPEPAGLGLAGVAALGLLGRRRRSSSST